MVEIVQTNQYQRKKGEPITLDTHIGERSIFKESCSYYGSKCMLGGRITGSDVLTVHHIIPVSIGGENTLRNVALLVDSKHVLLNQLEHFDPNFLMDINAFLYEYRGKCKDDTILSRIYRIMAFAEDRDVLKEAITKVRRDKTLDELYKLKKHINEDDIDFSIIPDLYNELDSINLYFPDLGGEVRKYLSIAESCEGNRLVLKRIRKILGLVEQKRKLDIQNSTLNRECISSLERTKDVLRARTKVLSENK